MSRVTASASSKAGQQLQAFANTSGTLTAKEEALRKKWGNAYDELNTSRWNEELKATQRNGVDTWSLGGTVASSWPSGMWLPFLWGVVAQGSPTGGCASNQRSGREIRVKNFYMNLHMTGTLRSIGSVDAEPLALPLYRIMVVIDKQPNGNNSIQLQQDLLQMDPNWLELTTWDGRHMNTAVRNLDNQARFQVIDDFVVKPQAISRGAKMITSIGSYDVDVTRSYDVDFTMTFSDIAGDWQDISKNVPFVIISCDMGVPSNTNIASTPDGPGIFDESTVTNNVRWFTQMTFTDAS